MVVLTGSTVVCKKPASSFAFGPRLFMPVPAGVLCAFDVMVVRTCTVKMASQQVGLPCLGIIKTV